MICLQQMTPGQKSISTMIRTIPTSILTMAKAGQPATSGVTTTQVGTKTIVIAAPKGSTGALNQPTKIITSVPKLAGQSGNTQFIVVSPQSVAGAVAAGKCSIVICVRKMLRRLSIIVCINCVFAVNKICLLTCNNGWIFHGETTNY